MLTDSELRAWVKRYAQSLETLSRMYETNPKDKVSLGIADGYRTVVGDLRSAAGL